MFDEATRRDASIVVTPQRQRQKTLETLATRLVEELKRQYLIFLGQIRLTPSVFLLARGTQLATDITG